MPGYRLRDRTALFGALVVPLLLALALVPFRTLLSPANEALVLVVAVVAVAASGTRAAAALAALSAAASFGVLLVAGPYRPFAVADRDGIETAVLLLVVGLVAARSAVRARRLEAVAVTGAAHLSSLQDTARLTERGGAPDVVVEFVRRELIGVLGLRGCRFEYGTLIGHRPRLEHDGALRLRRGREVTGYADWPDGESELRAVGGGHYYGRFLLDPFPGRPLPPEDTRSVALALAALAGAALDTAGMYHRG
ncbi:DUF4118 domain-containing protein [Streptomyces sp. NPDC097617]|uniref:DUF4118 domain-containing protein n=1 Tax=Streptomyces sp. NPDC097617 TaxID=3366091 RepID=UPI0037FA5667